MNRKITVVISFLLLCQFCASAQNWLAAGGGVMPPDISVDALYLDSANNRLVAKARIGAYWRALQFTTSNNWDSLGNRSPAVPNQFVNYRGSTYSATSYGVYEINGSTWQPLFTSHGQVNGFYLHDTDLYAYGMFDSIGGIAANKIARYDGYNWFPISNPTWGGGAIRFSSIYQNKLCIGGNFYNTSLNAYSFSAWENSQWFSFGNTMFSGSFDGITCMAIYNGELYVGGYFGNPGSFIARWDGNTWTQVGGGFDGQVFCMKVFNGELWVGGSFYTAGGVVCPSIAKYNGTDWCNVGNFDNTVTAIEEYNGELYVGGGFWTVDGDSVLPIVKWIGGNNTNACGHLNTGIEQTQSTNFSANVFPNPATTSTTFQFRGEHGTLDISICDQLGREVWRKQSDENDLQINTAEIAPGLYFYRVCESGETKASGKLIIE